MPTIGYEKNEVFSSKPESLFVSLKNKGDKIHIRILGSMFYDGKHFIKNPDNSWNVIPCVRTNKGQKCSYCEEYFKILSKINKDTPKDKIKEIKKEASKFKPTLTFYIPVLDRDKEKFRIFKTKLSIRRRIEEEIQMGTPILERDFIVLRTEKPGADYYTMSRVDSADTKPLTDKEKEEIEKYKETDIESLIFPDESQKIESEEIDADDIPF